MLERIRTIQNTWVGKAIVAVVMGLIMVSFVIWGIGPVFTGFNANTLANVGGDTVTVDAFRQAYQNELQQLQQRTRRPITNAQAHQFGLDTQVLSQLVSEAVLDHQARAMGLSISQGQIVRAITSDPAFTSANGQFDRARFQELLSENGMSEQGFVREQRATYLRQELVQGLVGGLTVPQDAIDAMHRLGTETRSIDYVTLPASAAEPIPAPDDAALKAYFDAHGDAFRAPEYRKLVILPLLPQNFAKPQDVSDADVDALYQKVKDQRFTTPEYRTLQQIVFPTEAEATAAAQAVSSGKNFADLAAERHVADKDLDLGRVTKAGLFDKALADAAFSLPEGGTSGAIKTAFGGAIVHVVKIEPSTVKPIAEVAPALRLEIATGRTGDAIRAAHDKIEDGRNAGQSLAEAAKAAGLEVRTVDAVSAAGRDKAGLPVDLPDSAPLLKAAFASDVGMDNEALRTPDGGQIFYEVASIDPARPQTLDEVKPAVEAAWRHEEVAKRLAAKADDLVKALQTGRSVEDIAKTAGDLPVGHAADVRRAGGTGLNAATVAAVFGVPVDGAGSAVGDGDTRVVFKVLGSTVPPLDIDTPQVEQIKVQYQNALADELLATYLNETQSRIGVRVNPTAFSAAIGSGS
jgi:peptidyl-prolyl cis-trans isomerase D